MGILKRLVAVVKMVTALVEFSTEEKPSVVHFF
jgi:hypothetical protein